MIGIYALLPTELFFNQDRVFIQHLLLVAQDFCVRTKQNEDNVKLDIPHYQYLISFMI